MSFIIKSSYFFMPAFKVSWAFSRTAYLKHTSRCPQSPKFLFFNSLPKVYSTEKGNVMPLIMLEKSIDQLNLDAKYKQKINLRDINKILSTLEHLGTINYHQSLILLRSCGSLSLHVEAEKRVELLQKALSLVENSGVELGISHFNTLLSAYIEIEQKFSPKEFLESIYKRNLIPSKVTFQKLLKAHCQQGDIAGASELLEKMKSEGMSLNEDIFNSLIYGHCQVNDITNAFAILDLMKAKGIEPSSETYVNLACGYAKAGEITEIRALLDDCTSRDIIFFDKDYLQIAYTLARSGYIDYIDEILNKLKKNFGYEVHVRYFVYKLLQKNLDSVALKFFETMKVNSDVENLTRHGKYLVEYIVKYRPVEQIIDLCQYFEDKALVCNPFSIAIREILLLEDLKKGLEMFSSMAKRNLPVRTHYFWPLLIQASKEGNDALLNVVEKMRDLKVYPCLQTLSRIIFPNYNLGENWQTNLDKLQNSGIDRVLISRVMFKWFLRMNKLVEAKRLASSYPFSHKTKYFIDLIVQNFSKDKDADFFVEMLYIFLHDLEDLNEENEKYDSAEIKEDDDNNPKISNKKQFMQSVMLKLLKVCDEQMISSVLKLLLTKKIGIPSEARVSIEEKFNDFEVKELLNKLCDENLNPELDKTILAAKKKKKNREEVGDLIQEAIWTASRNLKNNRSQAVEYINEFLMKSSGVFTVNESKKYKTFMMLLASGGYFETVEEFYQKGIEYRIIGPKNFYPLVYALLVSNKLEEATNLFCQKALETKCKSSWHDIVTKLIEEQKAELLQKVTDVITEIDNEAFSVGMLISQFAKLGKSKEIQKLLDTKGFVLPKRSLDFACQWLFKNNSTKGLETLLFATKNVHRLDRTNAFNSLLKLYILEKNSEKAMTLWWLMDEENIVPSSFFMREFEAFLQKMNKPLPFNVKREESKENELEKATL